MSINDETIRLARAMRIMVSDEANVAVRQLVRAWARAWDEIHGAWAEAMMDLAAASTDGHWPSAWEIARSERATAALAAATDQIVDLANLTGVTVVDAVGKVVAATDPLVQEIIASQLPDTSRAAMAATFNRVDPLSLNAIVSRSTQAITSATYMLGVTAQEQMRRTLIRGIAMGDNPRKTAAAMVKRAEGTFNGGLTRALVIARTETLDAHRQAARGSRVANESVCTGWTWLASLDNRTCPSCLGMNGTVHDIAESGPDDHQQGRCVAIPVTKSWADLGIDLDEPASIMPDAQAWFGGLGRDEQLAIMGPGRLDALDRGAPWDMLAQRRSTPGWRDSYAPTPVADLLAWVA